MTLDRGAVCFCLLFSNVVFADVVTFQRDGVKQTVEGNMLAQDSLGTILFEGRDTAQFVIEKNQVLGLTPSKAPLELFSRKQLQKHLEKQLGGRFKCLETNHYTILYSGDSAFANEAGKLFERTYTIFSQHFYRKGGFRFDTPKQPLVAIIYSSREEYTKQLQGRLGDMAGRTAGVYIRFENRMYLYDELGGKTADWVRSAKKNQPQAADEFVSLIKMQNSSTVIHEAVHQLAFNLGFHHRGSQPPSWFTEGMAMYFETPEYDSAGNWRASGVVNPERLHHFERIFAKRGKDPLTSLITIDQAFRSGNPLDRYSEAWALTFYMCQSRPTQYIKYVKLINARPPMVAAGPNDRLKDFQSAFGQSPKELDADFRRFIVRYFKSPGKQVAERTPKK